MSLYERIYLHPTLNSVLDNYILAFLNRDFINTVTIIDEKDLRKAGWLASILADSELEEHRQKAQIFATLLHIMNKDNVSFSQISYVIFSRTGNLLATRYLTNLFDSHPSDLTNWLFKYSFGPVLDYELGFKRIENTIRLEKGSILATDFQKILWKTLFEQKQICISAPTSSGKSFILKKFIETKFYCAKTFKVLYIVPSKALLNEVSDDFRQILGDDVIIKTAFIDEAADTAAKLLYVLTPERCLKLLQKSGDTWFFPHIVFVDEIQNVEDEHGRGVLMEYVLAEIAKKWDNAVIISAGPFIENSHKLFERVFLKEGKAVETNLSPVFQIKASVRLNVKDSQLELYIQSFCGEKPLRFTIPNDLYSCKNATFGQIITRVISVLGNRGQSIVYASRTDLAEKWALLFAENVDRLESKREIEPLLEYLEEEIHPKYYLIKCLKANTAFHHSKLPDIVRREIEYLFKQGEIEKIFCTSTLLQGVNLPAHNLFITSPKKKNMNLSGFEFGNLSGRAGRINDSLFGSIFCIEKEDTDESWGDDYYSKSYKKEVIPATTKALGDPSFYNDLEKMPGDISETHSYVISFLRHKFLSEGSNIEDYLMAKGQTKAEIKSIIKALSNSLNTIKLSPKILNLNPSIDPLLQDQLYSQIKAEGIENWVLIPNHNFYRRIGKEYVNNYAYDELSFYWQLATICEKLDFIFNIKDEAYFKHDISLSLKSIAYFGFRWLQNKSYKEIIDDDIRFYAKFLKKIDPNSDDDINKRINEIINIHTKIVTFLLVKYFKVLADVLEYMMTEEENEKYRLTLSLPIMLELGTTEPVVIQLISAGITRSVALKVFGEYKKSPVNLEKDIFEWLRESGSKLNLKSIYLRYLKKLKFIR
ncbi:MAG: DEAD/DEAH box helicase [Sporomusaceae bacterium]|nr:DEAD/DEAH box helicase [Sporomusaceae bacterium]